MNSFQLGKFAALENMAEMIDEGADLEDIVSAIEDSLGAPLRKNASEGDQDWRLGVESACHDFLSKTASYYGNINVSDESEALLDIFEKVAEDAVEEAPAGDAPGFGQRMKDRAGKMYEGAKAKGRQFGAHVAKNKGWYIGGGVGAGALGAGALLARHLYKKRQEEEAQNAPRRR